MNVCIYVYMCVSPFKLDIGTKARCKNNLLRVCTLPPSVACRSRLLLSLRAHPNCRLEEVPLELSGCSSKLFKPAFLVPGKAEPSLVTLLNIYDGSSASEPKVCLEGTAVLRHEVMVI